MRWIFTSADPVAIATLSREAKLPPMVAQLLVQRGIVAPEAAQVFLNPQIAHLHSPYLMKGMKAAVERLRAAIARQEKILIYGDYDVDGTVAIVILKTAIEICGGQADFHVPHRIRDGYGMKDDVIEQAAAAGVRLIISVDTGIRAFAAAETAERVGLDLIVTDHHLTESGKLPQACAVLNPNQPGCGYPCKELCGAGVAFKIAQALLEATGRERLLPSFLKMVAIATVSDAVPLTGENRVFTKLGLEGLRHAVNPGLKELLRVAALDSSSRNLTAGDIGFRLGPRLNAAGRMDVAGDVIELFTTKDAARARELAERLNKLNSDRQQEEARTVQQIQELLDADPAQRQPYCLVLDGEGWHRGVIGIVATRVVERYGRPTLIISRDAATGEAHGSGRSIPAFHLLNALEDVSCRKLFTRFGGHAHAVGFALPSANIPALRLAVDAYARKCLSAADFESRLEVDGELAMADISAELFAALAQLQPFGLGNREPVFALSGAVLRQEPRILKEKHLKLRIGANQGKCLDAVGWRMAERLKTEALSVGCALDLAFNLDENTHPDFPGLQLVLRDYRQAAGRPTAILQAAASSA
jgi:single-stranded-DNA-specific exonuclease